jgi:hypothetical protein
MTEASRAVQVLCLSVGTERDAVVRPPAVAHLFLLDPSRTIGIIREGRRRGETGEANFLETQISCFGFRHEIPTARRLAS